MERPYLDTLVQILQFGSTREGRNGLTSAIFAKQLRFDMSDGKFPMITTKKLPFKVIKGELLWFLAARDRMSDNDLKKILESENTIWTANANSDYWKSKAKSDGDLGRIYGAQWRTWTKGDGTTIDQLGNAINLLKTNPFDRRMVVSAWNAAELDDMALPPCHMIFQYFVDDKNRLSLHMVQRSCDMFLGVPFNIASYALLLAMTAQVVNMDLGELVLTLNDCHIYHEHFDAVAEQLDRKILPSPKLSLNKDIKNIDDFTMKDIELVDYQAHPAIKAAMLV